MKTLLIVYHSSTGGTRQMAEAAATAAATESGGEVRLLSAVDAGPDDVLGADGYIFAAPENLAALSGLMKDFFDRCYYPVLGQIDGRPYALMICAGSDGANAARQAARIATGWRLRAVAEPLIICTHAHRCRSDPGREDHPRKRSRSMPCPRCHACGRSRHGSVLTKEPDANTMLTVPIRIANQSEHVDKRRA